MFLLNETFTSAAKAEKKKKNSYNGTDKSVPLPEPGARRLWAVVIASFLAEHEIKNGVPHILESHPRERRARMGHPVTWESNAKTKTGNRAGHPSLWTQMLSQGLGIAAPAA